MSTPNLEDTAPIHTSSEPQPAAKKARPRRWVWILAGVLLVLVGIAGGALIGYGDAIRIRQQKYQTDVALKSTTQFQLGLEDQKSNRFEMALRRFQYVIQLDPKYPGAAEKLAEVMIAMASTATRPPLPTSSPTPAVTATPDTRGEQEMFNAARQAMADKDWDKAITTLDSLRKLNRGFQAIQVDGMYYVALRNRGMDKIRRGQLEEGMYDMSLTEQFGPLDKEAETYRTWARLYVTGASFWELDWTKVINYFSQLYAAVPSLIDSSGMSTSERYRQALVSYADQLVQEEKYCEADEQIKLAMQVSPDGTIAKQATSVYKLCYPPTPTKAPVTPTSEEITPELPTVGPTEGLPTPETPVPTVATTEAPPAPNPLLP